MLKLVATCVSCIRHGEVFHFRLFNYFSDSLFTKFGLFRDLFKYEFAFFQPFEEQVTS